MALVSGGGSGGGGTVTSVTAADTSITIAGTSATPTVATGTLDVIATNHAPAAAVAMNAKKITGLAVATAATDAASLANSLDQFAVPAANVAFNAKKITGLANGSAATDAAAYGQIPYIGYVLLQDQKTAGTNGGTCTAGSFQTRTLNTEVVDTNSDCSLASNQITLAAGTYDIVASAPALFVSDHQTRLQNVTDASTVLGGTSEYAPIVSAADGSQTRSFIYGRFTIAASKALEIQHRSSVTRATTGFGAAANFGLTEIYTVVQLWRVS